MPTDNGAGRPARLVRGMSMDVIMPQLGETVREGTVAVWYRKVGDLVKADDPLFEVETDKVTTEIPAPASGVLAEILVEQGIAVKVGTRIAVIRVAGEAAAGVQAPAADPAPPAAAVAASASRASATSIPAHAGATNASATGPAAPARGGERGNSGGARLSPVVRRLLAEHRLDPAAIHGRGAEGRITRQDVMAHLESRRAAPAATGSIAPGESIAARGDRSLAAASEPGKSVRPAAQPAADALHAPVLAPGPDDTVVAMNRIRRLTAVHMVRTVAVSPHTLQAIEVDFSAVEKARGRHGAKWKSSEGFSLTALPFVARAVCAAIARFPHVNASVADDALIVHHRIHLGIAVDLNFEGLLVPVIRDAQNKTLRALALEIHDLASRARRGALRPDEMSGGTYTISNSGPFGTLLTAPLIAQPQVAILSTDAVRKKPVVIEGPDGDSIAIRPIGVLAQNFDHRAFDGAYSAAFLHALKDNLESRDWLAELP